MEYKLTKVKAFFPPLVIRLGIITSIVIAVIILFITNTAQKVHSDSEVSYRQESVFNGVSTNVLTDNSIYSKSKIKVIYEVGKVTPTPTPVIVLTSDDIWIKLAQCESKQNWSINSGNGYYGGLQFSLGAWASVGGQGNPSDASKEEQIMRGKMLQEKRGWGPWGSCSKKLGLL